MPRVTYDRDEMIRKVTDLAREAAGQPLHYTEVALRLKISPSAASIFCRQAAELAQDIVYEKASLRAVVVVEGESGELGS